MSADTTTTKETRRPRPRQQCANSLGFPVAVVSPRQKAVTDYQYRPPPPPPHRIQLLWPFRSDLQIFRRGGVGYNNERTAGTTAAWGYRSVEHDHLVLLELLDMETNVRKAL